MYGQAVFLYGSIDTVSESDASLNLYDFMVEPFPRPYRTYFEGITLISPDRAEPA
jgi:hypothetical protein